MFILVSGCAGFLGFHLCQTLLAQKHTVLGVDNLITGSQENVDTLRKNPNFGFAEMDICKYEDVNTLDFIQFDQIYHLASIASPEHYCKYPLETIRVNTVGTENLLKLALAHNATFLLTSTSEVYGNPHVTPQSESYKGNVNCYGPRACYDESKRLAETLVYEYRRLFDLDTKIVRIFNTYGPNMNLNDKRVIIEFVKNALLQARGEDASLYIFGDGTQTRSFTYVSDTIDGLIKMMNSDISVQGPINIGNDNTEYTIGAVAILICEKIKIKMKMSLALEKEFDDFDIQYSVSGKMQDDPDIRNPDITLAREVLQWEPKVDLETGLDYIIDWVRTKI